jgi:hypothetical protein
MSDKDLRSPVEAGAPGSAMQVHEQHEERTEKSAASLPFQPQEPKPVGQLRCACVSHDARRCYCLRYAPDDSMPKDEVCECSCHEPEDYDDEY